ncbi:hypothetical protein B0H15DRAFT_807080 [Mycena belliarum]|uniref:Uncharacterized protein n=1 Tax=Mycena belliarum TaxID=1033014 RepID=A0AAD6XE44_9AGAR|nr:hypothetical protein B0H15DRAFT_807080 [Mycena belliae]
MTEPRIQPTGIFQLAGFLVIRDIIAAGRKPRLRSARLADKRKQGKLVDGHFREIQLRESDRHAKPIHCFEHRSGLSGDFPGAGKREVPTIRKTGRGILAAQQQQSLRKFNHNTSEPLQRENRDRAATTHAVQKNNLDPVTNLLQLAVIVTTTATDKGEVLGHRPMNKVDHGPEAVLEKLGPCFARLTGIGLQLLRSERNIAQTASNDEDRPAGQGNAGKRRRRGHI